MNMTNNRDYVINHCKRPLHKFDRLLREWYLKKNPGDNEMQIFDDNLNNYYIVLG